MNSQDVQMAAQMLLASCEGSNGISGSKPKRQQSVLDMTKIQPSNAVGATTSVATPDDRDTIDNAKSKPNTDDSKQSLACKGLCMILIEEYQKLGNRKEQTVG